MLVGNDVDVNWFTRYGYLALPFNLKPPASPNDLLGQAAYGKDPNVDAVISMCCVRYLGQRCIACRDTPSHSPQ
jgi:hypothetical protein